MCARVQAHAAFSNRLLWRWKQPAEVLPLGWSAAAGGDPSRKWERFLLDVLFPLPLVFFTAALGCCWWLSCMDEVIAAVSEVNRILQVCDSFCPTFHFTGAAPSIRRTLGWKSLFPYVLLKSLPRLISQQVGVSRMWLVNTDMFYWHFKFSEMFWRGSFNACRDTGALRLCFYFENSFRFFSTSSIERQILQLLSELKNGINPT